MQDPRDPPVELEPREHGDKIFGHGKIARRHEAHENVAGVFPFADDEITENSLMRDLVIMLDAARAKIGFDALTNRLEISRRNRTAVDVDDRVEHAARVEPERELAAFHLIAEGVFHLIAIARATFRRGKTHVEEFCLGEFAFIEAQEA